MNLTEFSLLELARRLGAKECSSREATEAALARIRAVEPRVKAFLRTTEG